MLDEFSEYYADFLDGAFVTALIALWSMLICGSVKHPAAFAPGGGVSQGSDDDLDNAYLMRMTERLSRRVRAHAEAHHIPVIRLRPANANMSWQSNTSTDPNFRACFWWRAGPGLGRAARPTGQDWQHRWENALAVEPLLLPHHRPRVTPHTITTAADGAITVFAADVDGDGDMDVLSASAYDDKIAWYENDGRQNFTAHTITTTADGGHERVRGGRGRRRRHGRALRVAQRRQDRLVRERRRPELHCPHDHHGRRWRASASSRRTWTATATWTCSPRPIIDDKIAWYENDGSQNFTAHTVTTAADGASSVFRGGRGRRRRLDVLSASRFDKIAWYENDGSQNFAAHTIAADALEAAVVMRRGRGRRRRHGRALGVDRRRQDRLVRERRRQNFHTHTIITAADGAVGLFAADVDGDGDMDVLSASTLDDKIAWYENLGWDFGNIRHQQFIFFFFFCLPRNVFFFLCIHHSTYTLQDISDRKLYDKALQSRTKYSTVVEQQTPKCQIDQKGKVISANLNYALLTGHKRVEEIIGRPVTDWTAPYEHERNAKEVIKCLKKGSVKNLEVNYQHTPMGKGQLVPIEINATITGRNNNLRLHNTLPGYY